MPFVYEDAAFIGTFLSHLFLGVYITVFGLYVQITRVKNAPLAVLDYGLITLFVLTLVTVVLDTLQQFYTLRRGPELPSWIGGVNSTTSSLSITLDFLSQVILIYRCWNIWGQVIWVMVLPGVLAFASWVCGLTVTIDLATILNAFVRTAKDWWVPLGTAAMTLSLVVNALVSTLMISRIWYVYRQSTSTVENAGGRLSWVASVLLESAIALFIAQLIYLVLYKLEHDAFALVAGPVTIIYGLNCTAIMVRVGMNQSFERLAASTSAHSSLAFVSHLPHKASAIPMTVMSGSTAQWDTNSQEKARQHGLQHSETETTLASDRRV